MTLNRGVPLFWLCFFSFFFVLSCLSISINGVTWLSMIIAAVSAVLMVFNVAFLQIARRHDNELNELRNLAGLR